MDAVYRVDGSEVETRVSAGGPWNPSLQHGAAPVALVAWVAERIESPTPMRIARITADLLRPVPVAPLEIGVRVTRQGRKIQLAEISLSHEGLEVVRASVLKTRLDQPPLAAGAASGPHRLPSPEEASAPSDWRATSPFLDGVSSRLARGTGGGSRAMWFRAERPIVEGEAISPSMRASIAADFCNGVSTVLNFSEWTFLNADVTLSLARLPVGEWILVDAETWLGPDGAGIAHAKLGDIDGYFGQATQTLLVEHR